MRETHLFVVPLLRDQTRITQLYLPFLSDVFQVLQFPPALYHYITGELLKQVIVVLNKIDLCPAPLVLAWKHYLTNRFPNLQCVCFTSHPGQPYSSCESTSHLFVAETFVNRCIHIPVILLSLYVLSRSSVSEKANEEEGWVEPGGRTNPHSEGMSGDHGGKRSDTPNT